MDYKEEFIVGVNPILEAIKSGRPIETILISRPSAGVAEIMELAKDRKIPIKKVGKGKILSISNNAQGIAARVASIDFITLDKFLTNLKEKSLDQYREIEGSKVKWDPFIIICDSVEDPRNLGSIIRTAEGAGADGIIIPNRRGAPLSQTVFKTSAGAANLVPIVKVTNINTAIKILKENGIWVYGAAIEGEAVSKTNLSGPVALVLGNEKAGISPLTQKNCDKLVSVPMVGNIQSLNVSVAGGIMMYEVVRTRLQYIKEV